MMDAAWTRPPINFRENIADLQGCHMHVIKRLAAGSGRIVCRCA